MALVVRVKRLPDNEPLEALVLSCKRRKTNAELDESLTAIFKFAGTVTKQDENINENIAKFLDKQGLKELSKTSEDVFKKSREQAKSQSKLNRYKFVNYFRALEESASSSKEGSENKGRKFTVLDVEANPAEVTSENSSSGSNEKEESIAEEGNFVYDLYHGESANNIDDMDDLLLDGLVSVNPYDELVHDSYKGYRSYDAESDTEDNFEDEDSNDENNVRNDYPDEDEFKSDGDEDEDDEEDEYNSHKYAYLATGMERVRFGNEILSSDNEGSVIYEGQLNTDELRQLNTDELEVGTSYEDLRTRFYVDSEEEYYEGLFERDAKKTDKPDKKPDKKFCYDGRKPYHSSDSDWSLDWDND